jgi:peptide deformylase
VATLEVRIFGDPVLRQRAQAVQDFDGRLATLASDMLDTMRAADGVGLAANQVGVLKRLFTWEVTVGDDEDEDPDAAPGSDAEAAPASSLDVVGGAVVNPVLRHSSEQIQDGDEGCLSFPGLFYPVDRPLRIEVDFQDLVGAEHSIELEGFLARIWLHEMDHLDGILFIDHLAKHDRQEALKRMRDHRIERGLDDRPAQQPGSLLLGRRSL